MVNVKNKAAVTLGKLGGNKTKERGAEYYREISAKGKSTQYPAQCTNCEKSCKDSEGGLCSVCRKRANNKSPYPWRNKID